MGIAKMNKVYLLAHQADKDRILSVLQQSGLLEVSNLTEPDGDTDSWSELVEKDQEQEALQKLEGKLSEVRFNLDFLNRYHSVKKGLLDDLLATKKAITTAEVQQNSPGWAAVSEDVYVSIKKIDDRLMASRNEETRLQNISAQLLPWQKLTVPLEQLQSTKTVTTEFGTVSAKGVDALQAELAETGAAVYLQQVDSLRGEAYLVLVHHHDEVDVVQSVLKRFNFTRQTFSQFVGTPRENLSRLEAELIRQAEAQTTILAQIAELVQYREPLQYYLDYLTVQRDQKQVVESLVRTSNTFALEGWTRRADLTKLKQQMAAISDTIEVVDREPYEGESFPVLLENNALFAPFEFVTKLYGAPSSNGIDPTAAFTPFFIIFYGMALTDAGYGIFLILLSTIGLMKIKGEGMRKLLRILFACGISTIIFGWLLGGWFGYSTLGAPLYFDALKDPMRLLIWSLAIGIIHIFWGMMVKMIFLLRSRSYFAAFADVVLWYGVIIGLLLLISPVAEMGKWIAIVSAIGLILTQGRSQPTIIKKFFSGVLSLYNITGYLSDILSYSRLLALGLATGVVSLTVNTMAGLLKGSIPGYIAMVFLLIAGHIFNLAINALGAFIHSSRLQYIEFYNRFYEGGGKNFKPFALQTRHIDIQPQGTQNK